MLVEQADSLGEGRCLPGHEMISIFQHMKLTTRRGIILICHIRQTLIFLLFFWSFQNKNYIINLWKETIILHENRIILLKQVHIFKQIVLYFWLINKYIWDLEHIFLTSDYNISISFFSELYNIYLVAVKKKILTYLVTIKCTVRGHFNR